MAENNFSLQKTLTMLLDEKKYHSLRDILSTMNPADIAAIFDDLDQARLPLLFRLLPKVKSPVLSFPSPVLYYPGSLHLN